MARLNYYKVLGIEKNSTLAEIKEGKRVYISSNRGVDGISAIAEMMVDTGFDWLVVDLEHSSTGLKGAEDLIRTVELMGCVPLVRLSSNDAIEIKHVMDAGAQGGHRSHG